MPYILLSIGFVVGFFAAALLTSGKISDYEMETHILKMDKKALQKEVRELLMANRELTNSRRTP